jgi:hypothetical protein
MGLGVPNRDFESVTDRAKIPSSFLHSVRRERKPNFHSVRFVNQDGWSFLRRDGRCADNEHDTTSRLSRDAMILRSLDAVGEFGSTFLRISSSIEEAKTSLAVGVVILG